jgi:DNA-binding response OmpR family regulator
MTETIKKILLIDDEEVILFGFKQVLSGATLRVDTASTVAGATGLIEKTAYDAAVVDLRLTNSMAMEGLVLVHRIKLAHKNCRIIVLTAYGDDEVKRRAFEAGADFFLEKPVNPESIKKMLSELDIR